MSSPNPHAEHLIRVSHDLLDSIVQYVERWLPGIKVHQARVGGAGTLSILLASGALLYLWRSSRSNHPSLVGEKPPLVSYWVPWVGSALRVQKDPDALIRKAQYVLNHFYPVLRSLIVLFISRELGPVFGVKIFGTVLYHVTDADVKHFCQLYLTQRSDATIVFAAHRVCV